MLSRISRRTVFLASIFATALSFFTLGVTGARRGEAAAQASHEATLAAIRSEVKSELGKGTRGSMQPAGTAGHLATGETARPQIGAEIQEELQGEMGLPARQLLRDRRASFVELYSY